MLGEVVAAHEDTCADGAAELLGARVRLHVLLQLVGARETLAAEEPVADERPVAAVPAQVRLQVRRLGVGLAAARDVAVVQVLPQTRVLAAANLTQLLSVHAVWAPAHGLTGRP